MFLHLVDLELKYCFQIGENFGVRRVTQFKTLKRGKYLFLFFKRKEGIITRHAYMCMIAHYVINGTGLIASLIQIITENNSFTSGGGVTLAILNMCLLVVILARKPDLNKEEKKIYFEYRLKIYEEQKKRKREKREGK